jgi:glycosyltransferase involved in cell wall biosynthesis
MAPESVEFLGERADMDELMRQADGFVLSSCVEGLPVALLEAAASGLPVVTTDAGGARETNPARMVPVGDAPALARAMEDVMALPAAGRAALGAAARERALAEWDWPVVVRRWVALYQELGRWT